MNIAIAFFAFNFIILAHEFGHFTVAKLSGIKVLEFSLFIGPKLFSFRRGETVYSLRLLPILAYVKMEGEEERSESDRAFNKKSLPVRAAVIAAGPLMNLFIAVILLTTVFAVTGYDTAEIKSVQPDSPAYISDIRPGDRIVSYNGKRVYKPVDVIQFIYVSKGKPAEVEIVRGDDTIKRNVVPVIPEEDRYMFGFTVKETSGPDSNLLHSVSDGMPAQKAGLKPGDRIVSLDGMKVDEKSDIDSFMQQHDGGSINVILERDGRLEEKEIVPVLETIPERYYLGADFKVKKSGFAESIKQSLVSTYTTVRSVAYTIVWLISGKVTLNQMMGPVGIVSTIGSVVEQSRARVGELLLNLLNITAFISIALGATNLIPFPALDGSKLLLIAVEGVRRKPLPPEKEAFITIVGFVLLMILAVFTIYNDVLRIAGG